MTVKIDGTVRICLKTDNFGVLILRVQLMCNCFVILAEYSSIE